MDKFSVLNELKQATKELSIQKKEIEKLSAELLIANKELEVQNTQKNVRAAEFKIAERKRVYELNQKEDRASELIIANKELIFEDNQKSERAAEFKIAERERVYELNQKEERASELAIANKELVFENIQKSERAAEFKIAEKERVYEQNQKEDRAAELAIANKELISENAEKAGRVIELTILNKKFVWEKKNAQELRIALKEVSDYKLALDASAIVSITDMQGVITFVNDNFCKISQYSQEELIGKNHSILNSGFHPKSYILNLWETISSGKIWKGEFKNKAKDNTFYWVDSTMIPFMIKEGKPYQYISIRYDITERKAAEAQISLLVSHLQEIREEERKRIGREIHDELGQKLTAIKMDVAWVNKQISPEADILKSKLNNSLYLLDSLNKSIRKILNELRPSILDEQGIIESMEWTARQFSQSTGIPAIFSAPEVSIKINDCISSCIYRIFQEAINNVTKYAHARNVSASLKVLEGFLVLIVEDDGVGFDTAILKTKKSYGISGMRERIKTMNGSFQLISSLGLGTKIIVRIPMAA